MERFGRYLLLERVACGGMAEVFRAATLGSPEFSNSVAIKMILPELAEDPASAAMLVEEARIAARLKHKNVVRLLDLGIKQGRHFIAMDFVAGQPAHNLIVATVRARQALPFAFTLDVVGQALQGLQYAHGLRDSRGYPLNIVHRDVSPQNIMVGYDGRVCLLDFGIAKATHSVSRTRAGVLRGKAGYVAPEVVRGSTHTQSADLYAMGVVLYELVALRRMRTPRHDAQALTEAAHGTFRRFDEIGVEVPEEVARLVYRALDPDPDLRFPDATSFLAALQRVSALFPAWNAPSTAALMADLFPAELAAERDAATRFSPMLKRASLQASPTPSPFPALPPVTPAPLSLDSVRPARQSTPPRPHRPVVLVHNTSRRWTGPATAVGAGLLAGLLAAAAASASGMDWLPAPTATAAAVPSPR